MGPGQCNFIGSETQRHESWQASSMATPVRQTLLEEGCTDIGLWLELVEARMNAGMTPEDLASQTGLSLAQVMRIERGEIATVSLKFLRQYAHGVGRMAKVVVQKVESGALCSAQSGCQQERRSS